MTTDLASIRTAHKSTREILRDLQKRGGWSARQTKSGHIRLHHVNGGTAMIPGTPGQGRSLTNTVADLRRIERSQA